MAALFPRWSDTLLRTAWTLLVLGTLLVGGLLIARVNLVSADENPIAQPMWFDHQHHVTAYRIDCRYCHSSVERAASAGMPATSTCLPCHNRVWRESAYFEPVRASLETDRPIAWRRVYDLPDFVYFHHGVHVQAGVGCESCHGRVDRMPVVRQVAPLTMDWCLDCHRDPAPHLRPRGEVTTMGYDGPPAPDAATRYPERDVVTRLTTCTACHR